MTINFNGEEKQVPDNVSVQALLSYHDLDRENARGIAVAVNDEVVPREKWSQEIVHAGDTIDVITAQQGG